MKKFTIPSLAEYFYLQGLPPDMLPVNNEAVIISNLYGHPEPFLLDKLCLLFLPAIWKKDALVLDYMDPENPTIQSAEETWKVTNPNRLAALKNTWFNASYKESIPARSSCFIETELTEGDGPPLLSDQGSYPIPSPQVLGRYKQPLKASVYELYRLGKFVQVSPDELRFFFHFPHWHGLMNSSLEKMLEAKVLLAKQHLRKKLSRIFQVHIENGENKPFLKITIPPGISPLCLQFDYPRWLKTTPYPFLLDKEGTPLPFHIRLINNDLLEPTGRDRLCNRYELYSSVPLKDIFYFGFTETSTKKSLPVSWKRQERVPHIDTGAVRWKVEQRLSSVIVEHQNQNILTLGPLSWSPCNGLHDQGQKHRFMTNTRFRVLERKENEFLTYLHLCQSIRVPLHKVHNQQLKTASPVRQTIHHQWQWYNVREKPGGLYTIFFDNCLANGFLGLFLNGELLRFFENSLSWKEGERDYVMTTGFSIPIDNVKSLFMEFPFPVVLERARFGKQKGWLFPLLQSSELIDCRWTGHHKALFQPRIFLPKNDQGKRHSYTFLIYFGDKQNEEYQGYRYNWNLPDPWEWGRVRS